MDNAVKMILKKLDEIDSRLSRLESPRTTSEVVQAAQVDRDPLFPKALEVIDKYDEISAKMLADLLKIDIKRAEKIMDQMEAAGIGSCYMKDV